MSNVAIQHFIKLRTLFKSKGWDKNFAEDVTFSSFGHLMNNLNHTEQELILELIERYLWIDYTKYVPLLKDVLSEYQCSNDLGSFNKVYFFPVIKPRDQHKTKSGNVLIYLVQTVEPYLSEPLKSRTIVTLENYADISEDKFNLKDDEVLVLIDDFLGTGTTASETLQTVLENKSITPDKVRVIGFTAMQESVDLLAMMGVKSFIINVMSKGISDYYGTLVENKLVMMKKIEKMTKAGKDYKLGYKKSESLVTMARTPNNTFSIFWSNHIKDDIEYQAPFPR